MKRGIERKEFLTTPLVFGANSPGHPLPQETDAAADWDCGRSLVEQFRTGEWTEAENFGLAVEAVCLALLVAVAVVGLFRVAARMFWLLKGIDGTTRIALLALLCALAPVAVSKHARGVASVRGPATATAFAEVAGDRADNDDGDAGGLRFTGIIVSNDFVLERGSAAFENIYIRMMNPQPQYYGWFIRRHSDHEVTIRNCTINAAGAGNVTGIAAIDSPVVHVEGCSFLNFPAMPCDYRCGVLVESVQGGSTDVSVLVERCLFDESFTNQYPVGRIDGGAPVRVAMRDCIVPCPLSDYLPEPLVGLVVTNGQALWNGYAVPGSLADARGIGSVSVLPVLDPSDPSDRDGDGLPDYAEMRVHGTDPWLADSDFDGVDDLRERLDGTDPCDGNNFAFDLSLTLSGIFRTTNDLTLAVSLGADVVHGPVLLTNKVFAVTNLPLVATTGGLLRYCVWDDANFNGELDMDETHDVHSHAISGRDVVIASELAYGSFDKDNNNLPDWWEAQSGLSVDGAPSDEYADPDGDGLVNLHEFWAGSDPLVPDGSNTLVWALAHSIDERIKGRTCCTSTTEVYTDYTVRCNALTNELSLTLTPNVGCWAHGLDFSAVGICCKNHGAATITHGLFPTAISDRHIIFAKHCGARTNDCYRFRTPDGIYTNLHLAGFMVHPNESYDLMVGILDGVLPPSIKPVKFLPSDYHSYIGRGQRLPTLRLNQWAQVSVQEVEILPSLSSPRTDVIFRFSEDLQRYAFFKDVLWGDSGHPSFFLCGDDLVFLFTAHHTFDWRKVTAVPAISLKDEIEEIMNMLSADFNVTNRYQVQEYDFTKYGFGGEE